MLIQDQRVSPANFNFLELCHSFKSLRSLQSHPESTLYVCASMVRLYLLLYIKAIYDTYIFLASTVNLVSGKEVLFLFVLQNWVLSVAILLLLELYNYVGHHLWRSVHAFEKSHLWKGCPLQMLTVFLEIHVSISRMDRFQSLWCWQNVLWIALR